MFCFVESKTFEFLVEEEGTFYLLHIFKRGQYFLRSVAMAKESAKRMFFNLQDRFKR